MPPRYIGKAKKRVPIKSKKESAARGAGVHGGEFGVFSKTPHPVVLAWMKDCLELWKQAGWGWTLWDFRGHKLDRAMLDLLMAN